MKYTEKYFKDNYPIGTKIKSAKTGDIYTISSNEFNKSYKGYAATSLSKNGNNCSPFVLYNEKLAEIITENKEIDYAIW